MYEILGTAGTDSDVQNNKKLRPMFYAVFCAFCFVHTYFLFVSVKQQSAINTLSLKEKTSFKKLKKIFQIINIWVPTKEEFFRVEYSPMQLIDTAMLATYLPLPQRLSFVDTQKGYI